MLVSKRPSLKYALRPHPRLVGRLAPARIRLSTHMTSLHVVHSSQMYGNVQAKGYVRTTFL